VASLNVGIVARRIGAIVIIRGGHSDVRARSNVRIDLNVCIRSIARIRVIIRIVIGGVIRPSPVAERVRPAEAKEDVRMIMMVEVAEMVEMAAMKALCEPASVKAARSAAKTTALKTALWADKTAATAL